MLYPNNWAGLFICEAMLTNHNFTLYIAKVENFSETTLLYLIVTNIVLVQNIKHMQGAKKGKSRPLRIDDF